MNLKKQLSCVYASSFFAGLRITDAVRVALLAARSYSLWQIGLAEGVYHTVSLLCEVPSGMMADLLGRHRSAGLVQTVSYAPHSLITQNVPCTVLTIQGTFL